MKKKWLTVLLSVVCTLACAAFFGCDEGNAKDTGGISNSATGSKDSSDSSSKDIYGPMYEITYETTEYLANVSGCNPEDEKAGETVTIATHILTDVDLWVFVNGERIEQVPYDAAWWGYTFVMPDEPVHITFEVKSLEYLVAHEPWLFEISAEDIAEIKESKEIAGIAPGNFITHYTVTDSKNIANLLEDYRYTPIMENGDEDTGVCGGLMRTVTFTMKGGPTHSFRVHQGIYRTGLKYFYVLDMPDLTYYGASKSYSFITISGNCDIFELDYANGSEARLAGGGNFLADLEFVEYHGAVPENLPPYYILGEYFEDEYRIYVQDNSLFFMWSGNGYGNREVTYYQVLGDVDLFALIEQSLFRDTSGV